MNEPSAIQPSPLPPYREPQLPAPPYAPPHAGAPTAVQAGFGPPQHPGYAVPPPPPQAPPPARRKRRPVLATLVAATGALVGWAIFGNHGPDRFPPPPPSSSAPTSTPQTGFSEAGTVSAFDLQPGDCYNTESLPPPDGSAEPIRTVDAVPCTEPHTDQVVAKIGYQASDDWVDVRDNRIDVDCGAEFDRWVEKKILDDETYLATYLFPVDHDTWKWRPAAVCVVSTEQPTTGSVLKS